MIDLESLCEVDKANCARPFGITFRGHSWLGATNGHALLLVKAALGGRGLLPPPKWENMDKVLATGVPHQQRTARQDVFFKWAGLNTIPDIGKLAGRLVNRLLVRRYVAPIPTKLSNSGVITITSRKPLDPIEIMGPNKDWFLVVMPLSGVPDDDEGNEQKVGPDFPDDWTDSPKIEATPVRDSRTAQALAQLQGPAFARDKAGVLVNKWGEPVKGRYR